MRLYYSPNAASRVAHIALVEAGADYELVLTNTRAGDQRRPEYLAVNPKGRVPALETDQGVLTETPAILLYIAQRFPQARLAPLDDPFALAQVQARTAFLACEVQVAFAMHFRSYRYAEDPAAQAAIKAYAPTALAEKFALLEDMHVGPWAAGEAFSIVDPFLFVMTAWLEEEGLCDARRFPKLQKHASKMRERPSVKHVVAVEGPRRLS